MSRPKTIAEEDLLSAAREVFIEGGFAASTKRIAKRAGVSEALLFQRYGTKADLFFASMVPPPMDMGVYITTAAAGTDGRDTLERLAWAMLDYFRAAVPMLLPLMSHPDFDFERFAAKHPASGLVVLRVNMGEFFFANRAPDPAAASLLLLATMQSVAMFELLGAHGGKMPDEIMRRTIAAIWRAVEPKSA